MSRQSSGKRDQETNATLRALRRAAKRARELGFRTGTPVYVIKDDRIVDLTKEASDSIRKPLTSRSR